MQFSLNGWPPLASHLTCLLAGYIISNLSYPGEPARPQLPKNSIFIPIQQKHQFIRGDQPMNDSPLPRQVAILIHNLQNGQRHTCKIEGLGIQQYSWNGFDFISLPDKSAAEFLWLLNGPGRRFQISDRESLKEIGPCSLSPIVEYGK